MKNEKIVLNIATCEGRHTIAPAVDGAVFGNEIAPEDLINSDKLKNQAAVALNNAVAAKSADVKAADVIVNLYITGLTVAVIAAISAAKEAEYNVVCYHYDRNSGNYYPQYI